MKKYNPCQSCSMPLSQDPQNGGTEADGAQSEKYCSYCYRDGVFTAPEIDTAQKMQKFCIEKMHENGTPKFFAWILTRGIPRLERWK